MLDWFVVYTSAGGERLAKEDLEALGFQVFMPTMMEWHRVPDHRRRAAARRGEVLPKRERREHIMYPRYLFVGMLPHWHDWMGLKRSKRVQEILSDPYGIPRKMPERIVRDIMTGLDLGTFEARALAAARVAAWAGMRVVMKDGPFKGAKGVVTRANKNGLRIDLTGLAGAAFPLNVTLDQIGLLDIYIGQDDQHKQNAPSERRLTRSKV